MGLTIFKILDKEELILDLLSQFYIPSEEVQKPPLTLKFFYKTSNQSEIKWKSVFDFFNVKIDFKTKDIKGLILITKGENIYAITYGNSAFLAQKYCNVDFGFELARKIDLKELKRKSTNAQRTRGRKAEVNTYINEDSLDLDSGRIFTSLSFTPVDESLGKRIDFGKSIKFTFDFDIEQLDELLSKLESLLESSEIKNRIPYLNKVKDEELIQRYDSILYKDLEKKYSDSLSASIMDVSFNEISIIGSSIYFEQEYTMEIKCSGFRTRVDILDLPQVFDFIKEHSISLKDFVTDGRIIYLDEDGKSLFSEPVYNFISYDIPSAKVSLFEGSWNEYNDDFVQLTLESVKKVKISHEDKFDNMNSLCSSTSGAYKEEKIINYLCPLINAKSIDKKLFRLPYEENAFKKKYQIELGDMVIDSKEYCSVKQGDIKSFNYCFDQSELAAEIMVRTSYSGPTPAFITVWLFMKKLPKNTLGDVDLTAINSIMLQRKIALWSSEIMRLGFSFFIRVNNL